MREYGFNLSKAYHVESKRDAVLGEPKIDDLSESKKGTLLQKRILHEEIPSFALYETRKQKEVITIFGVHPINQHTGEVYQWFKPKKISMASLRLSKPMVKIFHQQFHRLQSLVPACEKKVCKYNKFIGFHEEALIEKFTENDHLLFARFPEC